MSNGDGSTYGAKVFVVDDDRSLVKFVETLLRENGLTVRPFYTSEECYVAMEQEVPDLILADQVLPGADGCALLEVAKERFPWTWRILMTGKRIDDELVKDAVNRAGVHYFLQKPLGAEELLFMVKKALEDRRRYIQLHHLMEDLELQARKKANEALSFQRRYKSLFDRLHFGVFVMDWSGKILEINAFGKEMLGLSEDLEKSMFLKPYFPTSVVFNNMLRLLERRGEVRGLETVLAPLEDDASEVLVSITAFTFEDPEAGRLILVILEDLSHDVQLEAMLLEAQLQLRATIDAMKDIIFTVNRELEIVSCNKALVDFLGMNYTDFKGKRCFEVFFNVPGFCCVSRDDQHNGCPFLARVFDRGLEETRKFMTQKSGKNIYWEQWVYPIPDMSGDIKQAVIVFRDITETEVRKLEIERMNKELAKLYEEAQKKNQEFERLIHELKEAQAHLIQSEKMASIGQLSAGIAHEINNPVGFINSNLNTLKDYVEDIGQFIEDTIETLEGLEEECHDNEAAREAISKIKRQREDVDLDFIMEDISELIAQSLEGTSRVRRIVQDLKQFSHGGQNELEYVDINKCLESTLNIVWNELKYKAEVKKDYGELPLLPCFPQKLNQVFMNLLVNAAQAIEDRGEIRIVTRKVQEPREGVEVVIEDTGKGMTPEVMKKIFEPFFTTKPVGKGTGLGLHVSYKIVKAHKGEISVESRPGQGTRFTVFLPMLTEEELPEEEGNA